MNNYSTPEQRAAYNRGWHYLVTGLILLAVTIMAFQIKDLQHPDKVTKPNAIAADIQRAQSLAGPHFLCQAEDNTEDPEGYEIICHEIGK